MKRSGFKQKPRKPLKRSPLKPSTGIKKKSVGKRKKKFPISKIKEDLWDECRRIVRKRYARPYGWNCFTCDKVITTGSDAHTGHFIPSASCGAYLRYDLRNLRIQCFHCNINLGSNGAEYYRRLVAENGQKYVDQLFEDKSKTVKADIHFYTEILNHYKTL